jgi:hypothetical protein
MCPRAPGSRSGGDPLLGPARRTVDDAISESLLSAITHPDVRRLPIEDRSSSGSATSTSLPAPHAERSSEPPIRPGPASAEQLALIGRSGRHRRADRPDRCALADDRRGRVIRAERGLFVSRGFAVIPRYRRGLGGLLPDRCQTWAGTGAELAVAAGARCGPAHARARCGPHVRGWGDGRLAARPGRASERPGLAGRTGRASGRWPVRGALPARCRRERGTRPGPATAPAARPAGRRSSTARIGRR